VTGRTLGERLDQPLDWVDRSVIRPFGDPVSTQGGLIALSGTLAPDGAIFKRAAATPALFETEGRAVVFTGLDDLARRIDDPDLDVTPADILVQRAVDTIENDFKVQWIDHKHYNASIIALSLEI
jgi:dihydroxy-acid dehydratase